MARRPLFDERMKPVTVVLTGEHAEILAGAGRSERVRTLIERTSQAVIEPATSPRPAAADNPRRLSLTLAEEHRARLREIGAGEVASGVRVLLAYALADPELRGILTGPEP